MKLGHRPTILLLCTTVLRDNIQQSPLLRNIPGTPFCALLYANCE